MFSSGVKHLLLPSLNAHFSPFTFVSFALKIVRNSTAKHERIYLKKKTKKKTKKKNRREHLLFLAK